MGKRKQEDNRRSPLSLDNYFLKAKGSKCSYLKKRKAPRVSPLQLY